MEQVMNTPTRLASGQKRNLTTVYHNENEFRKWQEGFTAQVERTEKVVSRRKQFVNVAN